MGIRPLAPALLLLVASGTLARAAPAEARLTILDASEGCSEFWRRAPGAPPDAQASAFETLLRAPHPTLYTPEVLGLPAGSPVAASIPARLKVMGARFQPDADRVDEVRRTLASDLEQARAAFRRAFPDFRPTRPVYVICSVGAFDGAVRQVEGKDTLLFGPDVIAAIRPRGFNLRPLLEHELFHVFHESLHPDAPETIAWSLWEEGLATYVSAALNPGASHEEISVPDDLIRRATPMIPELSSRLLQHLDARPGGEVYGSFFLGPPDRTDVPARNGYLIGWRIAESLGRTRSLHTLARMTPAEARTHVERALREMAGQVPMPDAGMSVRPPSRP